MTLTITENKNFFGAFKEFLSQWRKAKQKKNSTLDVQKKLEIARKLYGSISEEDAAHIRENRVNFSERF